LPGEYLPLVLLQGHVFRQPDQERLAHVPEGSVQLFPISGAILPEGPLQPFLERFHAFQAVVDRGQRPGRRFEQQCDEEDQKEAVGGEKGIEKDVGHRGFPPGIAGHV